MGYSIAAPMKSEKAKNRMSFFMKKHYREPKEAFGDNHQSYPPEGPTSDLSHDDFSLSYGFNYSHGANIVDAEYAHAIVMWMSAKSGRTRKIQDGQIERYYRYDGDQCFPLRDDDLGWEPMVREGFVEKLFSWSCGLSKKNLNIIKEEIQRLDDLWHWRK